MSIGSRHPVQAIDFFLDPGWHTVGSFVHCMLLELQLVDSTTVKRRKVIKNKRNKRGEWKRKINILAIEENKFGKASKIPL